MSRPDLPVFFPDAPGAQTLKLYPLPMNNKALLQTLDDRNGQVHQAAYHSAFLAREVRMALGFGTPVGQFEMPGPFMHKRLMHQPGTAEPLKSTINGNFVSGIRGKICRYLSLSQRFVSIKQNA
jgi:hypothetical protein